MRFWFLNFSAVVLFIFSFPAFANSSDQTSELEWRKQAAAPGGADTVALRHAPICRHAHAEGMITTSAPVPEAFNGIDRILVQVNAASTDAVKELINSDQLAILAGCVLGYNTEIPVYLPISHDPISQWPESRDPRSLQVKVRLSSVDGIRKQKFGQPVALLTTWFERPSVKGFDPWTQTCSVPFPFSGDKDHDLHLLSLAMSNCLYREYTK